MKNNIKHELQLILQGKSPVSHGTVIQTIASYLRRSAQAGAVAQTDEYFKKEEAKELVEYIELNNLWIQDIRFDLYLSEGAEQRVYIKDHKYVYKLNDSIYYATWLDYLCNLLLNNYFFPDTAYRLEGFYRSENNTMYALVEQAYVKATQPTDLEKVKLFLKSNGFKNNR